MNVVTVRSCVRTQVLMTCGRSHGSQLKSCGNPINISIPEHNHNSGFGRLAGCSDVAGPWIILLRGITTVIRVELHRSELIFHSGMGNQIVHAQVVPESISPELCCEFGTHTHVRNGVCNGLVGTFTWAVLIGGLCCCQLHLVPAFLEKRSSRMRCCT